MKYQTPIKQDIIHVGLPKTGSTFLQNFFFPNLENSCHFSPHRVWDKNLNWVFEINKREDASLLKKPFFNFKNRRDHEYFAAPKYIKESKVFISGIKQRRIVSSEGLVGFSLSPLRNNLKNAKFVKAIFSNAKIVFIFRQQANYSESLYKQLIFKEDRYHRFLKFNDIYGAKKSKENLITYSELDWFHIYSNYCSIFGKSNVLALPYEHLLKDARSFISCLEGFIGEEASLNENALLQKENVSICNPIYKSKYTTFKKQTFEGLEKNIKQSIMRDVKSSNIKLSDEIGYDLSEYGYF